MTEITTQQKEILLKEILLANPHLEHHILDKLNCEQFIDYKLMMSEMEFSLLSIVGCALMGTKKEFENIENDFNEKVNSFIKIHRKMVEENERERNSKIN